MEQVFLWSFIRWGGVIALIGTFVWAICYTTNVVGLLERKKTGKHPFPAEKRSRERVQTVLNDETATPREKCLFINKEIEIVMDSLFVSREWKDSLFDLATAIMKENNLTVADF